MESFSILVVDDDKFMVNLIQRMLSLLGVDRVSSAEDGKAALAIVAADKPSIILCDLNMPGMDGLEFLRHLAERKANCGVILISGEDRRVLQTATQLAEAHELNVLGSIQKPVKPDALKALLQKFDVQQTRLQRGPLEMLTEEEIKVGLEHGYVDVFFQPKVSVPERKLVGVEALVRWQDPGKGTVPPIAFVSVAESSGLIDELTEQVFSKALAAASDWTMQGLSIKVAVNFSVDSLSRFDIVEFVVGTAEKEGIDPTKVILEVTESRIMEDIAAPLEILTRLRMKGVNLSIDDFGTGASSMQQLKRVPFTELKVDRDFVAGAPVDKDARTMLESSVELARRLGLSVVAEGVETEEEWSLIEKLGVDVVQGYLIAKPMPANDLLGWAGTKGNLD